MHFEGRSHSQEDWMKIANRPWLVRGVRHRVKAYSYVDPKRRVVLQLPSSWGREPNILSRQWMSFRGRLSLRDPVNVENASHAARN